MCVVYICVSESMSVYLCMFVCRVYLCWQVCVYLCVCCVEVCVFVCTVSQGVGGAWMCLYTVPHSCEQKWVNSSSRSISSSIQLQQQ